MSIDELPNSKLPDSQNASLDYLAAGKLIDEKNPDWSAWENSDSRNGDFQPPFTVREAATLNAIVAANQPALAMIRGARTKASGEWGDRFVRPYVQSTTTFDFSAERRAANLANLAAMAAHADGHDDEAVARLEDLLRLSNAAMKRPTLVGHLVAVGINAMVGDTLARICPDLNGKYRGQFVELLNCLEDEQSWSDGRLLCWRSERICMLDEAMSVADGTFGAQPNGTPSTNFFLLGYVIRPLLIDDTRQMMVHMQGVLLANSANDWPAAQGRLPIELPKAIDAHPAAHLLSALLVPTLDRAVHVDFRGMAIRWLAVTSLAIRLYSNDHNGKLPMSLDDLAPAYLPSVPIDPLSGKSILYKQDVANPRIYSVGDNGLDDGGVEAGPRLGRSRYGNNGDIVVYLQDHPRPVDPNAARD
jgi:hypothetical protein